MNISELNNFNNNNNDNSINQKNIKDDILFFKDDILRDIKKFEYKLNLKVDDQTTMLKDKLDIYELKMEAMTQKISSLGNKISKNISLKEKVDELYEFKNKIQGNILTQDIRIESIIKDLKDAINKYDSILLESVIYSGIIGVNAKFKTFHEFIDFVLLNINQLNSFKEKNKMDLNAYKKKIETLSQNLKLQIESINKNNMEFNNKGIKETEKKINIYFEEYNSKLMQIRMENNQYGKILEEKANLLDDNCKRIEKLKIDMEDKIKYEINRVGDISENFCLKFDNYQNEFKSIKKRFIVLSEFIKNNKFQNNDIKSISNKLKFNKKSNDLIEKENQEKFNQKIEDIKDNVTHNNNNNSNNNNNDNNNSNNNNDNIPIPKNNIIVSPDVPLIKQYIEGDVDIKELCEDRKTIIKKSMSNIPIYTFHNTNFNISKEIEIVITSKKFYIKQNNLDKKSNSIKQFTNLKQKNYNLNYTSKKDEKNSLNNENTNIDKQKKENNILDKNIEEEDKSGLDKKMNKIEEKKNKENYKYIESYNRKGSSNDKFDFKNKILENKIYHYLGFDEKKNDLIKKYTSENAIDNNNTSIISIINYGNKRQINQKDKNKHLPFLEYIKENSEEVNTNKKLFELRNNISNINKKNNNNNSDILSNTVSVPRKTLLDNKLYFYKTNKNLNIKQLKDVKRNNFYSSNKNISNSFIIYEKINLNQNKTNLEPETKKLSPIKLKGNNSSNDIIEKRINEIELCFDEDKKLEKLMEKIKDIIPFEEKITLSDRTNIKNIFSKKNNITGQNKKNK